MKTAALSADDNLGIWVSSGTMHHVFCSRDCSQRLINGRRTKASPHFNYPPPSSSLIFCSVVIVP